ncbi:similar to Saccharomyces cerevisiae YKL015W PUT3 Transcriptional activator of proline utilization genes [Maudiozyma barnettii]|uniref:Similar to Saccharomyces cerevisiae YKL015W PUT3 Transcriptional activator of proline utilization genes n=1 Tax=Maudiozyma barnettii TaxID=61262 RepID=A0A8H2ZJ09_9SACH|nr:Put3p [Kazachstania barnettii]CAB4256463.1 similar to Saccharomyces cerevisiae YKL015W PUT3 Transcriptional activator of proline utilization genes [Kazachstania barnettii]CAD1785072.1 similar to Saccharomyces cerevisiae YKL015W PUT3 Transcriptional activator of proline utilization genes [Kazachstania barnettii]
MSENKLSLDVKRAKNGQIPISDLELAVKRVKRVKRCEKKNKPVVACQTCRKKHLKCPGGEPCERCSNSGANCEYVEPSKKIMVSVKYLSELQESIQELKRENERLKAKKGGILPLLDSEEHKKHSDAALSYAEDDENDDNNNDNIGDSADDEIASTFAPRTGRIVELSLGQALFIGSSSMTLFGLEIQSLISTYVTNKQFKPMPMLKRDIITLRPSTLYRAISGTPNSVKHIRKLGALHYKVTFNSSEFYHAPPSLDLTMPSHPYAIMLIDKFISYNGGCFYFFNEGMVRHGIEIVYSGKTNRKLYNNATLQLIWHCKVFLIFAIGEVYNRTGQETPKDTDDSMLPGARWFLQASKIFNVVFSGEHLQLLTKEGGIEILLLYAFYLQVADNTVLAYFYFGQALRTCLVIGMHVDSQSDTLPRFQVEHQRRLWWTVYMFERMLSSKAGLPLSFTDYSISTELPADFDISNPPKQYRHYTFPEAECLSNCVKIVQINGYILGQLYQRQPKDNVLPILRNIIKQLFQWKANLSVRCQVDFSDTKLKVTRQLTNLFTEYFQGINLAIRPLLFHFVSIQLKTFKDNNTYLNLQDYSDSTTMLLNCSLQASVNTIRSFWELMVPDVIAMFGYMDREYLFTSSCTLLLFTTTFGIHEQTYEHLDHALTMFNKMISLGNNAAELRRAQLLTLMINLDFHNLLKGLILKHTDNDTSTSPETNTNNINEPKGNTNPVINTPVNDTKNTTTSTTAATTVASPDILNHEPMSTLDDLINASMAQSYNAPLTIQGTRIIETNTNQLDSTTAINMDDVEHLLDDMLKSNQTDNKLWKDITDQAMWLGNTLEPSGSNTADPDLGTFPLDE